MFGLASRPGLPRVQRLMTPAGPLSLKRRSSLALSSSRVLNVSPLSFPSFAFDVVSQGTSYKLAAKLSFDSECLTILKSMTWEIDSISFIPDPAIDLYF